MNRFAVLAASLALAFTSACTAQTGNAPGKPKAAPAGVASKAPPAAKAAAAKPGNEPPIRAAIEKAVPGAVIDSIRPSIIACYREVAIGGKVVYVSADGRYLLQGSLIE